MLEETVDIFNVDLAEEFSTQPFLEISQNSQECTCTRDSFQPATFNLIGIETPAYIPFCELCEIFQEHSYYGEPPANWF